jgi:hypothetical protein
MGLQPLPRWARGPLSVPCKPGTPTYKLQIETESGACIHVSPCALQYRTLRLCRGGLWGYHVSHDTRPCPPTREGSGATMCTVALDPASLQGRAPAPPCVLRLQTLPPSREGSDVVVHPVVPCGPHASSIKKSLVGMPVQLGSCVFKAHAHVFNTSDTRAIMGLQDMRAGGTFNAHMTCGQAATVRLQCNTGPVDYSQGTATVPGDPTARCHIAD